MKLKTNFNYKARSLIWILKKAFDYVKNCRNVNFAKFKIVKYIFLADKCFIVNEKRA